MQELVTARAEALPVKVLLINDGALGMVRQQQDLFWDGRRQDVDLGPAPDWALLARACGWTSGAVEDADDVDDAVPADRGRRPALLDVAVAPDADCLPMFAGRGGPRHDRLAAQRLVARGVEERRVPSAAPQLVRQPQHGAAHRPRGSPPRRRAARRRRSSRRTTRSAAAAGCRWRRGPGGMAGRYGAEPPPSGRDRRVLRRTTERRTAPTDGVDGERERANALRTACQRSKILQRSRSHSDGTSFPSRQGRPGARAPRGPHALRRGVGGVRRGRRAEAGSDRRARASPARRGGRDRRSAGWPCGCCRRGAGSCTSGR